MVHAFIMMKTGAGQSEALQEAVTGLSSVTEAHVVAGEFDLIAEAEGEQVYDVLHTASSSIQGFDGVVETKTYISLSD